MRMIQQQLLLPNMREYTSLLEFGEVLRARPGGAALQLAYSM